MFLHLSVSHSVHGGACMAGGMCGRGHVWQGACVAGDGGVHGRGACMAGGHAWQGGMHGRGASVAGGHLWQGGICGRGCAWQGVCMADTTRYGQ